jgi:hypothetical protein
MRRWLAVLGLVLAVSTGCASSDSPTPQATPTTGASNPPPVGYMLTSAQWHRMHSVNCHQPGEATYGF